MSTAQNKEFIYRGLDFERVAEFQTRITGKHPRAELLKYTEPPPDAIVNGDGQCIFYIMCSLPCSFALLLFLWYYSFLFVCLFFFCLMCVCA